MNKKKLLIGVSSIVVIVLIITLSITLSKNGDNVVLSDNENNKKINNSFLTLMLEQSDGTYEQSTTNTWPEGNYAFNSELSRCENGGELRWDRENGIVELLSNKSDACYVYFDLYNVVQISNVEATKTYNSITVTITTSGGENPVDKYYFSIDGGNSYQESSTPSYTFSNLTMNHEYTIQVYAKDTLGYESNEETIKVTTDNYINPTVNSVTATSVTNDSITVSVNGNGGTNNIQNYYYSINNGAYTSSSSNTYTFSGLSAGQTYQIRVYVKDTNGIDSNVYTINAETENVVYLADVCNNGNNLASCITNFYNTYGADATKIYYHSSSLANGVGDNSYRFSGGDYEIAAAYLGTYNQIYGEIIKKYCDGEEDITFVGPCSGNLYFTLAYDTNNTQYTIINDALDQAVSDGYLTDDNIKNYVCFGSTASTCPSDNLYRIIGVFGNQVKLIKNTSYGSYAWESDWLFGQGNTWNSSTKPDIRNTLNSTFLNTLSSTWQNKIANHAFKVGGMTYSNGRSIPRTVYNYEVGSNSSSTTDSMKIGLMYVSDYGYAASPDYWATNLSLYYNAADDNWMDFKVSEWTISRISDGSDYAFLIYSGGFVDHNITGYTIAVRPSFYLNSSVNYISGSGSSADPIRIN